LWFSSVVPGKFWYSISGQNHLLPYPFIFITYPSFFYPKLYIIDNRARIAQSVWRQAVDWMVWVRFPAVQDFPLLLSIQTSSGAYPTSLPMVLGVVSPWVKRQGQELTTHHHLVLRSRTLEPFPLMSSWHNV
jgi:hypothetical protein